MFVGVGAVEACSVLELRELPIVEDVVFCTACIGNC
ncbi:hypothetical protein Amal_03286 [Acetobacter malorum]|uniref:Uncharacterized protein n=1 Tax=Acetobacter malorum TaxID=178901 RepID=A0A177G5C1_9PROT|nr:hypothetical protein Amal_03286 [Acetobacter malorum]